MNGEEKDKTDKLIKWLPIHSELATSHGYMIWEEIKHFSWALYVVLAAPFILEFQFKISDWKLILIWPIIAIFLSCVAIYSIHKEGKDYNDAVKIILGIENKLGFHDEDFVTDYRKNKINDFEKFSFRSIRTWFKFYFLMLMLIGFYEIYIFIID